MTSSLRFLVGLALALFATSAFAEEKDATDCKDHPLLTRLPDYWIQSCVTKQFDAYKFMGPKGKPTTVEGQFWNIRYQPPSSLKSKPSTLQVLRNVENAVTKVGGKVVATDSSKETLTIEGGGKELWIEVWADYTGKYILTLVEKAQMQQQLAANAEAFANGLRDAGHVEVIGLTFDTGKAVIRPESKSTLDEVVKLLKGDATLKVFVVGHTDAVGNVDANMKLSQDRAAAVVQALTQAGIDGARLRPFGNGPFAPVASNDAEPGRAKNRRVELVKQ